MNPNTSTSTSSNPQGQGQGQPQRPRFVVPSVAAALDAPQTQAHRPPILPHSGQGLPPPQGQAQGQGLGQGSGYGFAPAPMPPMGAPPPPPPMGPPMPATGPPARPAWQQRANNSSGLPPPPPPHPPGPMGPPAYAGAGGQHQQQYPQQQQQQTQQQPRSIYHDGAQPLISSGDSSSRANFARKRKALNDDNLFKLPDLPGAHPAPPSSASSSSTASSAAAPTTNPTAVLASRSSSAATVGAAILVNPRQRGNPVLDHILTVPWEYAEGTPADYVVGATAGVLFLSIKYHRLHPEYLVQRIRGIQGHFELRVLLVLVDVGDHVSTVREVNGVCVANDMTLILAASNEECAKYLELYKSMEHRPAEALMGRQEEDYSSRLTDALTQIKGVNRTDVLTLSSTFGTFAKIVQASVTDLASCPGIGEKKAQRIYEAFRKPFIAAADTLPLEDD